MKTVQMVQSMAGDAVSLQPGDVVQVSDEIAGSWVDSGVAKESKANPKAPMFHRGVICLNADAMAAVEQAAKEAEAEAAKAAKEGIKDVFDDVIENIQAAAGAAAGVVERAKRAVARAQEALKIAEDDHARLVEAVKKAEASAKDAAKEEEKPKAKPAATPKGATTK